MAEKHLGDGSMRPCDFCGHPVVVDSVDERDCPVCGEPEEQIAGAVAGRLEESPIAEEGESEALR